MLAGADELLDWLALPVDDLLDSLPLELELVELELSEVEPVEDAEVGVSRLEPFGWEA